LLEEKNMEIYYHGKKSLDETPLAKALESLPSSWFGYQGPDFVLSTKPEEIIHADYMIFFPKGIFLFQYYPIVSITLDKGELLFEHLSQKQFDLFQIEKPEDPFEILSAEIQKLAQFLWKHLPGDYLLAPKKELSFLLKGFIVLPPKKNVVYHNCTTEEVQELIQSHSKYCFLDDLKVSFFKNPIFLNEKQRDLTAAELELLFQYIFSASKGWVHVFTSLSRELHKQHQMAETVEQENAQLQKDMDLLRSQISDLEQSLQSLKEKPLPVPEPPSRLASEHQDILHDMKKEILQKESQIQSLQKALVKLEDEEAKNLELMAANADLEERNEDLHRQLHESKNPKLLRRFQGLSIGLGVLSLILGFLLFINPFSSDEKEEDVSSQFNGHPAQRMEDYYLQLIGLAANQDYQKMVDLWHQEIWYNQSFNFELYSKAHKELFLIGLAYKNLKDYPQSMAYFEQYLSAGQDIRWLLTAHNELGRSYLIQDNMEQAIDIYNRMALTAEMFHDIPNQILATIVQAELWAQLKQYNTANEKLESSLEAAKRHSLTAQQLDVLIKLSDNAEHQQNPKKQKVYLEQALEIAKKTSSPLYENLQEKLKALKKQIRENE